MAWYDNQIIDSNNEFLQYDCVCCDCDERSPGLSLDKFFEILCVNPYYGWQMSQNSNDYPTTPIPGTFTNTLCDQIVYQRCVNNCQVAGRDDICRALIEAEQQFRDFAGFWPFPTQDCDEHAFPCRGFLKGNIQLKNHKLLSLGKIVEVELETVAIEDTDFLDTNGNGIFDIVRLSLNKDSTIRSIDEIIAKRTDDETFDSDCSNKIEPISIIDHPTDDTLYQVDIPVWLLVKKSEYDWINNDPVDPADLDVFIREVIFCRRYVDGSQAITVMRDPNKYSCSCEKSDLCYECEPETGCIVYADRGVIRLDFTGNWCDCYCDKCAERICINYVSGECNGRWEAWIARLAASMLGRNICCYPMGDLVKYWSADFIQTDARGRITTPLSTTESVNPFGTRRAAIELYRLLRRQKRVNIAVI